MPRNLAALVIGNAAYAQVDQLQNPVNDATDMADRLVTLGFMCNCWQTPRPKRWTALL